MMDISVGTPASGARVAMAQATVIGQLAVDSPSAMKAFAPLLVGWLAPVLLLLFFLLRYFSAGATSNKNKQGKRQLPSPPALSLIGHLHLIGPLPHVAMRDLAARHGGEDLMLLRFGMVPTLVASSPSAAEAVLRTHDQSLASRPRSIFSDMLSYGPSDVALAPYGNGWRQAKMLVRTHMLSAKKVQSYRDAREEEVQLVIDKIRSAAMADAAVDMTKLLSSFTTDIVSRAVAGRSFREGGRDKTFKELLEASNALLGGFRLEDCFPGLAKMAGGVLMRPGRRKCERLRERWDEVLDKMIDEHAADASAGHGRDFTDVLLSVQEEYGLTRDGIKALLADMFAAGTDTVYLVLEFAMAELMLHKDVMARLQAEVRRIMPKDQQVITEEYLTGGMPYLKAVIKETLRLHPPSPLLLPHQALEDCTVDGYEVSAGTTVFVNAWAIGRDPRFWDAAEEFKPERFISKGGTEVAGGFDFKGFDFQFLPFGSGRRKCVGISFALSNIELILANLVGHFDWDIAGGATEVDMTEVFNLTLHRKEKLVLTPRLQPSCVAQPVEG